MTSDLDLLRQFARENSQDAFTEIVGRHVNLVYSAALRQVRSPQLAEEIAQSVFTDLARDAGKLKSDTILTAWLYSVTRRTAIDVIRKESRRQLREQIAVEMNDMNATANDWTQIEPLLDDAMAALDETDRTAILLRYFENKNLREVGESLKISDDAAQKRVSRAVERLREFFSKQKITVGASGLAVLISTNAVQSAPVGLSVAILTATSGITTTLGITMIHKILLAGFAAAAIGSGIYSFHLQNQIGAMQQQQTLLNQQIAQLSQERDDVKNQLAALQHENVQPNSNENELLKLRGEVGVLRRQRDELAAKNLAFQNKNAALFGSNTNSVKPQVHIKARFLTMPKDVFDGMGGVTSFKGILTSSNASTTLLNVESHNGVEMLAEPEFVTTTGRHTQMRATLPTSVVTNFCLQETNGSYSVVPQTGTFDRGPAIDVTPNVLSDGYTIELPVIASMAKFMGYASSTNTTPAYTSNGQEVDLPTASPQFDIQRMTNSANLLDGQTMVFTLNDNSAPADATLTQTDGLESKHPERATIVFVTANIVDPAGNRVHADSENYTNIPPQPDGQ
jgi:RNA polymerase sigma factor (sigma-70 family)